MEPGRPKTLRCAIYARKSSEEGLEQDFNSLHAQREACESFILSQQGEGWRLIKTHYDDGGLSGGTMERPALQRLLEDIRQKLVDVVVVYKVDRLTRALSDFAKMVEVFDSNAVSFVAVTQQFNTTTSMGRLTLNVLLSFAQFEREVTGERIRDKIAASKRKGMWVGGLVPLGFDVRDGKLDIVPSEAKTVRRIFQRYSELGSVRLLKDELDRQGTRSKIRSAKNGKRSGGASFSRGALYTLLRNPIYIGQVRHKGTRHLGLHKPIIERALWNQAEALLHAHAGRSRGKTTKSMPSPLMGKLFDESGAPLTPSHAVKGTRRYRYYVSRSLITGLAEQTERGWRVPAAELEHSVANAMRTILDDRAGLVAEIDRPDWSTAQIRSMLDVAKSFSERLRSESPAAESLALLVDRVELRDEYIRLCIKLPVESSATLNGHGLTHMTLDRTIPMHIRRRGVEMKLIIGGGLETSRGNDPALVKLIARARRWFGDLISGRAASMADIGRREKVTTRYVSRVVRFAFLAPYVAEQIFEGRQPPEFTAESLLRRRSELPLAWSAQRKLLGFLA
ncbi:MAG TPA: recombinase family protein [Candidatus Binatus sp.]|uniref:recombinase family protein n=1 Tax=Candidatus Binatus sp. TaxID=2811406 RepID=UPI002F3FC9C8